MQAVILAAGKGTRLKPLTLKNPKPLLKINKEQTIIEHTLESLPDQIDEVIIIVNYLKDKIKNKLGKEYKGRKIRYVTHKKLNGTAMALWSAKEILTEEFMVIHGDDVYLKEDLEKICRLDFGLLVIEKKGKPSGGSVEVDTRGKLKKIIDYPQEELSTYYLNTGAYKLKKEIFNYPPILINKDSQEYGLPQTLVQLKNNHIIKVVKAKKYYQINTLQDLEEVKLKIK